MKRLSLILLTAVFGLASFGVNIHYLYCCGDLAEVTVAINTEHEDCGMKMEEEDSECCETESVTLKVTPDQTPGLQQDQQFAPFVATAVIPASYYLLSVHTAQNIHPQFHNLPPPFAPDRVILFANFRI